MALFIGPSISINRFQGGYKQASDYTDLSDTETNDAQNVVYGENGDLDKRAGSIKVLNSKLTSISSTQGAQIVGHYHFVSLGDESGVHVVAAGDSLFAYTSACASRIKTGLTENSESYFTFAQIEDPRSPTTDLLLVTNGVDQIQAFNQSQTAINLSSFTSASGVPLGKYILSHKNRIYVANINNSADSDAPVRVDISSFGTDGAANPHIFRDFFYAGGSNRNGQINGIKILNDQLIIYTERSVWKFSPGSGNTISTASLIEMQEAIGLLAPRSLVDLGNFHMFLSNRGIYGFDGNQFVPLSDKVKDDLLTNSNRAQLKFATASFNPRRNEYVIYYAAAGSTRNNKALTYNLDIKAWQPPLMGREVSIASQFMTNTGEDKIIYGDYLGYLYEDDIGTNDGIAGGFNGALTSATFDTVTDSAVTFPTANDGLAGLLFSIISGTGEGQTRRIIINTSETLTLESGFTTLPDTTSKYAVAAIDAYWRSKDYDFGGHDLLKLFRHVRLRVREEGNFPLLLYYIINFKGLNAATSKEITLFENAAVYGSAIYGADRYGGQDNIVPKISLRNTASQNTQGTHIALRFSNRGANETFRITGFDIETKAVGKR